MVTKYNPKAFAYCSHCDCEILYGDVYVTIERNIFQHVKKHKRKKALDFVDGDALFMFCATCSKKFDSDTIFQLLNLVPHPN